MNILPGNLFHVYNVNLTARSIGLPKFMIVVYAPSASTWIIHVRGDELPMLADEHLIPMQRDKYNSDHTIKAVRYKSLECRDEQGDRHKAMKQSDKVSGTDWRKDLTLPDDYSAYRDKRIDIFTQLESLWDKQFGSIKVVQHPVKLKETNNRQILFTRHRTGQKVRKFEQQEMYGMIAIGVVEPLEMELVSPLVIVPKKDGPPHFCINYCKLNEVTIRHSYQMPRIEKCIDLIGDATIF